jgi:pyridoxine kinase
MPHILSIQSAVTMGAVGNTMANLVMPPLGHQLCRVDTIQLAAHPGHGFKAGGSLDDDDFTDLLDGLVRLQAWQRLDGVMTGYMARPAQAESAAAIIRRLKSEKDLPILIDPAIGDHGRLYVDHAVAEAIADHLFDVAEVITPNAFELGHFTGMTITDGEVATAAARQILAKHPNLKGVAVTGLAGGDAVVDLWISLDDVLTFEGPRLIHQTKGLSGGGDLFAAIAMGKRLAGKRLAGKRLTASNDWRAAIKQASQLSRSILMASDHPNRDEINPDEIIAALSQKD